MTAIVSFGYRAERCVPGQPSVPSFTDKLTRDDYRPLFDAIADGINSRGHVIAVYPEWSAEPTLRFLETSGSALDTRKVAVHASSLPPLAGGVLAGLAAAVGLYVTASGVLHASLPALERELVVLALLGSVAGLSVPEPSMAQHLVSMMPSSTFGVTFWPEPAVKTLSRKDRSVPLPTSYRPMSLAVSASEEEDTSWIDEVVAPALGGPAVKRYGPTPLGRLWWGTQHLIEGVAYPIDVPVTARRVGEGLSTSLCRWCGEAIAAARCPFCGIEESQGALAGGAA
jgi:hypothetical protein